jgi:3beta-hydroxy-delta5-steroid dehydrogenase/steroid delta-isomerase
MVLRYATLIKERMDTITSRTKFNTIQSKKKINIGPKCLVTGGAGFLGRALTRELLSRGYTVHVLDRRPGFEKHGRVKAFSDDIRDYNSVLYAIEGCRTVFHTAAVMNFLGICDPKTRREVYGINVEGTLNIIRACLEAGVSRLVYTSTNTVCFSPGHLVNGDESRPYAKKTLDIYAKTKIEAERAVLAADNHGALRTVAIRPAGLWGAGEGCYMVSKLVDELKKGAFVATVGDGTSLADNTHLDNLVLAELLAAEKLIETPDLVGGQAYFVTDEEQMNLIEWFRPLIEGLGYRIPSRSIPTRIMYWLAFLMECLHRLGGPKPFMTRLEVHNLTTSFTFRCDKARRELGYRPVIGQAVGMKQCVAYYRKIIGRLEKN